MNKDINVTPELEPTSNLGPFKFFALTNFPYIEQTFDTLTNYELMCKIAEALNKFIQNNNATNTNVINLYNAFVSLQDYVNQYFDNLNVQNEVNTKLDQMASDGTLETIINENIFNELNTNLENLTNKVGSETLPSPDSSVSQNINILNNKIGIETLPKPEESIIANINSLNEDVINNPKLSELVVFGDSWSDEDVYPDHIWPTCVANTLHLNLHNYAVNAATITGSAAKDFNNQISTFINDESFDHDKVKYIVLLGGINDYRQNKTVNEMRTSLIAQIQNLQNECKNADILFVNNCQYPLSNAQSYFWLKLNEIITNPVQIKTYNLDGQYGRSLYDDTLYHLTRPGNQFLARNIVACLTGGEITRFSNVKTFTKNNIVLRTNAYRDKNIAKLEIDFRVKTASTSYSVNSDDVLDYGDLMSIKGGIYQGLIPLTVRYNRYLVEVQSQSNLSTGGYYRLTFEVPIESTLIS